MNSSFFRDMIFPHIHNKQQRKEVDFIYCLNIRIADYRQLQNKEFNDYVRSILHFSQLNSQNNLVSNEVVDTNFRGRMIDMFTRTQDGRSTLVDIRYISPKDKKEMDEYLMMTGWNKPIDKYAYVYEGCQNDNKLFIGGKKDMIVFYCKKFPKVKMCENLMNRAKMKFADKGMEMVLSDPEKSEKLVNSLVGYLDKAFAEGMERVEDENILNKMSKENNTKI